MMDRQIHPLNSNIVHTVGCVVEAIEMRDKIIAKIAEMDDVRVQLIAKRDTILTNFKQNALHAITTTQKTCAEQSLSVDNIDKPFCKQAKEEACKQIKSDFNKVIEEYNKDVATFKSDADYTQLKTHTSAMQGIETPTMIEVIGQEHLDLISCKLI